MQAKVLEVIKVGTLLTKSIPPFLIIHAEGFASTSGWSQATLLPWIYLAPPADGILDLEFVATPPSGPALMVISRIEAHVSFRKPDWVRGVRVHASLNSVVDDDLGGVDGRCVFAKASRIAKGDSLIPISWAADPDSWPWLIGSAP
jgi:hypothetical protein